jgi:replication-associated recombination protein RarA
MSDPSYLPPRHDDDPWTRVETRHGLRADELVSTLQKEIRRGHTENAAVTAYEMASSSPDLDDHLWRRLRIISVEDIGLGNPQAAVLVDALARMRQEFPWPAGERFLFAVHAVRVLAGSTKDRTSDEMTGWIMRAVDHDGLRPEIPDHAYDQHTRRGQEMGRDFGHWFLEGAKVEPELADRDRTYRERLLAWHGLEEEEHE